MADRVRVTGPPRHAPSRSAASRLGDVHQQTPLGDLFLRSLLRDQLVLAARVVATMAVSLGVLPLIFHLWPELADVQVLGLSLPWVLLGVVVYPFLVLLAWRYVRRAERNEQVFAELVSSDPEPPAAEGDETS